MVKENVSLDFRLTKIDETRNCFLREIKRNDLMSKKHKKTSRNINYFEDSLLFISAVTGCFSVSVFASLASIHIGIASPSVRKMCTATKGVKKYMSIFKKKKKKHGKIVLLAKTKVNTIDVLISKTLIDSCINHDEVSSVNNVF